MEKQLQEKQKCVEALKSKLQALRQQFASSPVDESLKTDILKALDENFENCHHSDQARITKKKTSRIYGGNVKLPERKVGYVNLSSVAEAQQKLLNLGLNCHVQGKNNSIDKKAELELLYRDILQLEKDKKVEVRRGLQEELIGEGAKLGALPTAKF